MKLMAKATLIWWDARTVPRMEIGKGEWCNAIYRHSNGRDDDDFFDDNDLAQVCSKIPGRV